LVKFINDATDPNACFLNYWPASLDHALPEWADSSFLLHHDTTSADFEEGSLSHFWHTMSQDSFCFYGDVYDTVYEPAYQTGYYQNNYSSTGGPDGASGYVIWEALTTIDNVVDFSEYDTNPQDGVVEAIQVVFRNWPDHSEGLASLGRICDPDSIASWPIVTNDSVWDPSVSCSIAVSIGEYSGTRQKVINNLGALAVMCHEWGHRMGLHHYQTGEWGLMSPSSSGISMCAPERLFLDWITPREISYAGGNVRDTLSDALSTGDIVKVVVDTFSTYSQEEQTDYRAYFLIENRQPVTFFDKPQLGYPSQCHGETPGWGLLVTEVYTKSSGVVMRLQSADGRYITDYVSPNWLYGEPDAFWGNNNLDVDKVGVARDAFNEVYNNTFAPYTNPNSYIKICAEEDCPSDTVNSGFAMCNVRRCPADTTQMIADFYFGQPEAEIVNPTTWAGRVILDRDLAISDHLELTPGSVIWIADNVDYMGSGHDTEKVEIVIHSGGQIDINGETENMVSLAPDTSESWTTASCTAGDWYGVEVLDDGMAIIEYCDIGYGVQGIRDSSGTVSIEDCNIHHCAHSGICVEDANTTIATSTIADCDTFGVYVSGTESALIRSCTLEDNPVHVRTADADLDLGDMATASPGNAGWNTFAGGDTCVSNTDADTLLAQGNHWDSNNADTVASRMSGAVLYDPWLPLPPDSVSSDLSYVKVVDGSGAKLDFVRGLTPLGDGSDFIVRFALFDLSEEPIEGLDAQFLYTTVESDTMGPSCECGGCEGYFNTSSACVNAPYLFYCQPSNDTLFATQSTDASGISEMVDNQMGGAAWLELRGYVGPLQIGKPDTTRVNSPDLIPCGNFNGIVDGSDFVEFGKSYNKNAWYGDYVDSDPCTLETVTYPTFKVDGSDFGWFTDRYSPRDTCSCE